MSERNMYQERDPDSISPRSLLANARESDMQTAEEVRLLREYHRVLEEIESDQGLLYGARRDESKGADGAAIARRINENNHKLFELESTAALKGVLEREKQMAIHRTLLQGEEALEWQREREVEEYRKLLAEHQASRQAAIKRREEAQRAEAQSKETEQKDNGNIFLSVLFSALGLAEFYLIYFLTFLAVGIVFLVFSYVPLLGEWLLGRADSSPDLVAVGLATVAACFGMMATGERVVKNEKTLKGALMIVGVLLVSLNAIFLIANLIYSNSILVNIVLAIAGIGIFLKGKNG